MEAIEREERLLSALGVMLTQSIADRISVTPTELKTLDLFNIYGPMTPGRLADLTGLTSGGVTRLIDRLERAGYVRREPDPADRRRIILHPQLPESEDRVSPLYRPALDRLAKMLEKYGDRELELILDYIQSARQVFEEEIVRIRERPLPAVTAAQAVAYSRSRSSIRLPNGSEA